MTPDRKGGDAWSVRHEIFCSAVTGLEDLCTCGALTRTLASACSAAPSAADGSARSASAPRLLPDAFALFSLRWA